MGVIWNMIASVPDQFLIVAFSRFLDILGLQPYISLSEKGFCGMSAIFLIIIPFFSSPRWVSLLFVFHKSQSTMYK